jgi:hypothetical protein
MGRQAARILFSVFLILLGVVVLLSNLNVLPFSINNNQVFWLIVFAVAGLAFLAVYVTNARESWWAIIPALTLLGLAGLVGIPALQSQFGGAFFLGMIGLSFWVIYLTRREMWWAIIPGGTLLTLAAVAGVSNEGSGFFTGGLFFLGLALTFLVVYLVPTEAGRMRWAIWPAGVLAVMGALVMTGAEGAAQLVWPLVLIAIGGFIVFRAFRTRAQ